MQTVVVSEQIDPMILETLLANFPQSGNSDAGTYRQRHWRQDPREENDADPESEEGSGSSSQQRWPGHGLKQTLRLLHPGAGARPGEYSGSLARVGKQRWATLDRGGEFCRSCWLADAATGSSRTGSGQADPMACSRNTRWPKNISFRTMLPSR